MKAKSRRGGSLLKPIEIEAIDGDEYDSAFLTLVRLVQQQAHPAPVEALEKFPAHEVFSRRLAYVESLPPISHYSPFVGDGVIRVGEGWRRRKFPWILATLSSFLGGTTLRDW